jgi:hypothetical protein
MILKYPLYSPVLQIYVHVSIPYNVEGFMGLCAQIKYNTKESNERMNDTMFLES